VTLLGLLALVKIGSSLTGASQAILSRGIPNFNELFPASKSLKHLRQIGD
jgi:hypothetical protein